jgi:hypothetical protein
MTFKPGAMTNYELRDEIEHHRAHGRPFLNRSGQGIASTGARRLSQGIEERRELRSVRVPQADAPYPDDAS